MFSFVRHSSFNLILQILALSASVPSSPLSANDSAPFTLYSPCGSTLTPQFINRINLENTEGVIPTSFNALPVDPYISAPYRKRRYSRFAIKMGTLTKLPKADLVQETHALFGGLPRTFEELDRELTHNSEFIAVLTRFAWSLPGSPRDYIIGVHQIRITADPSQASAAIGKPAPEGRHQDGMDYIGIWVVNRSPNVRGAMTLLATAKDSDPLMTTELPSGTLLLFNDREYWHDTSPIESSDGKIAHRDVFILTAQNITRK